MKWNTRTLYLLGRFATLDDKWASQMRLQWTMWQSRHLLAIGPWRFQSSHHFGKLLNTYLTNIKMTNPKSQHIPIKSYKSIELPRKALEEGWKREFDTSLTKLSLKSSLVCRVSGVYFESSEKYKVLLFYIYRWLLYNMISSCHFKFFLRVF